VRDGGVEPASPARWERQSFRAKRTLFIGRRLRPRQNFEGARHDIDPETDPEGTHGSARPEKFSAWNPERPRRLEMSKRLLRLYPDLCPLCTKDGVEETEFGGSQRRDPEGSGTGLVSARGCPDCGISSRLSGSSLPLNHGVGPSRDLECRAVSVDCRLAGRLRGYSLRCFEAIEGL
jgi:hypothetical protein